MRDTNEMSAESEARTAEQEVVRSFLFPRVVAISRNARRDKYGLQRMEGGRCSKAALLATDETQRNHG